MRKFKVMTAYKVVKKRLDGTLWSAFDGEGPSPSVQYQVGKIAKPVSKDFHFLFIFKSFKAADDFVDTYDCHHNFEIFRCEAYDVIGPVKESGFASGTYQCKSLKLLSEADLPEPESYFSDDLPLTDSTGTQSA